MKEQYDIQKLLNQRKLTRSVEEILRNQLKDYLLTLSPLLRPRELFGDYIQGGVKETRKGADKLFKELQGLYDNIAETAPFNLSKGLASPVEIISSVLEITPLEYTHLAMGPDGAKKVTVTSPLKWVLSYSGRPLSELKGLLGTRSRNSEDIQQYVLHFLVMHVVTTKQIGVAQILEKLHFPLTTERFQEFGDLPVTCISSSISTFRPPDEVIIESTEISGSDAFEEIVNVDDIASLQDPLKERLVELIESQSQNSKLSH